jgi:hypothetical protein
LISKRFLLIYHLVISNITAKELGATKNRKRRRKLAELVRGEVGFEIVTRDGRTFLDKIKPQPKKKIVKYKTTSKRHKTTARKKSSS